MQMLLDIWDIQKRQAQLSIVLAYKKWTQQDIPIYGRICTK